MRYALIIALLLATPLAHGFGISPATVELTPDTEQYTLRIINSDEQRITLSLNPRGAVGDFLDPLVDTVALEPGDDVLLVPVRVSVPAGTLPGEYSGGILIEQVVQAAESDVVRAIPAVVQTATLSIPRQGAFLDGDILLSAPASGERMMLTTAIENVGTQSVQDASVRLEIRGPTGDVLETLRDQAPSLAPSEKASVSFSWVPEGTGRYSASAIVSYSGKSLRLERSFEVGSLDIVLGEPSFGEVRLGEVVRTSLPLSSSWNTRINGVLASVEVRDQQGSLVDEFTSLSTDLAPRADGEIVGFWNTAGLSPGRYSLSWNVHYAGRTSSVQRDVALGLDEARVVDGGVSWVAVLVLLAALIVLGVLAQRLIRRLR